jgi:hypothetical protein
MKLEDPLGILEAPKIETSFKIHNVLMLYAEYAAFKAQSRISP